MTMGGVYCSYCGVAAMPIGTGECVKLEGCWPELGISLFCSFFSPGKAGGDGDALNGPLNCPV